MHAIPILEYTTHISLIFIPLSVFSLASVVSTTALNAYPQQGEYMCLVMWSFNERDFPFKHGFLNTKQQEQVSYMPSLTCINFISD